MLKTCKESTLRLQDKVMAALSNLALGRGLLFFLYVMIMTGVASVAHAVVPGTVISNTASVDFEINSITQNRNSNVVDITTSLILSDANLELYQFSPDGDGVDTNVTTTGCSAGNTGIFTPLPDPVYPATGPIDISSPVNLLPAPSVRQGNPVFIKLQDRNRNIDINNPDILVVTVNANDTNDTEVLELIETGDNTGEFTGFIQTGAAPVSLYDCQLAVAFGDTLTVNYTDSFDSADVVSARVLIDPFGIVFSSQTGAPVDGVTVTIVDAATGLPADVFSDAAGTISYPSTIVTGSDVVDGNGTTFSYGTGEYRFPFVSAGTYRLELTTNDYEAPSAVSVADLQALPGSPFELDSNASFGLDFPLIAGPPLHVDIPVDPLQTLLFVTKQASKSEAGIGDFIQYELTVTNNKSDSDSADVKLIDTLPVGFRFQEDSLNINGIKQSDPQISDDGMIMNISLGTLPAGATVTIKYVVEVTSGAPFGKAVNTAFASDASGLQSAEAKATVEVQDDLISSKSFIIGTVTEGSCKNENNHAYGHLTYQLNTRKAGDNLLHTLIINKSQEFDQSVDIMVELPASLKYVNDSTTLNNKILANPEVDGQILHYQLNPSDLTAKLELKFSTLIRFENPGSSQIAVIIKSAVDERRFEALFDRVETVFNISKSEQHADSDDGVYRLEINKPLSKKGSLKLVAVPTMKGVEGVRLFMEDGRYVLTDQRGMYHFEGLEPGAHVVQIDPSSIPDHLEIQQCVENTRTAGSKTSQFVDIKGGLMWRVNYYLKEKPATRGILLTSLNSSVDGDTIEYKINLHGKQQPLNNIRATVILPDELEYLQNSTMVNGAKGQDPRNTFGTLTFNVGNKIQDSWQHDITFKVKGSALADTSLQTRMLAIYDNQNEDNIKSEIAENVVVFSEGQPSIDTSKSTVSQIILNKTVQASGFRHPQKDLPVKNQPEYGIKWLDQQDTSLEWLLPAENHNPAISSVSISIKHASNEVIVLKLNGKEVNPLNFDSRIMSNDRSKVISSWKGVDIKEGDNKFTATAMDRNGNELNQLTQVVHMSGEPVRAELVPEYSRLEADGKNPVILAVRMYDRWGFHARPGVTGNFTLSNGYTATYEKRMLDDHPLNDTSATNQIKYVVSQDGIAFIEIEPTTKSGKVKLDFAFIDDRDQSIEAWLQAVQKEWILVGLAEGTTGYNDLSGNMRNLDANHIEEDFYEDGRLAFYAKGQVKGEWLLTTAYDSKKGDDERDDRLFQTISPDEYYTLYGDATEQQFDAASQEKLYLKLEKSQFYAMFGDYETGLDVTELAKYTRSLNGIKTEFEGDRFGFNAFASETDQLFVQDEIRGNGTSGLYQLSHDDILINSEQIKIVTRDRFQPNVVIEEVSLAQFTDYTIDTNKGTIYFKQPIPSRDENFNPVYIIADYEVGSADNKELTAGIRASLFDKERGIEVGFSAITQGDSGNEGDLVAADLEYDFSDNAKIRLEAAQSNLDTDDGDVKSNALLAEIEHRLENTDSKAYYRRQEAGFGLDQQSVSNDGTERYGVDVRHRFSEKIEVNGQLFRDEVLEEDNKRTVADVELAINKSGYGVTTGFAYAKDELAGEQDNESLLAKAGVYKTLLEDKLRLRANAELDMSSNNSVDYPTRYLAGADYQLNKYTTLFAENELTQGDDQDTNTTRVGTRLTPWQQAEINTSVEQQSSEDGRRLFSNLGLTQGWVVNDQLSLDFSIDRLDTWDDENVTPFNDNVPLSSGSTTGDFTAISTGANYIQNHWSASSRLEYRTSDTDIQRGLILGFYSEEFTGMGMSFSTQIFQTDNKGGTDSITADATYALAYRPDYSPYTVLNRLDFSFSEDKDDFSEIKSRKLVNNLNVNYTLDDSSQLAVHWGAKYVLDHIDDDHYDGFTNLIGFQYTYDLNRRIDLSVHGDVLSSTNSSNTKFSFGPSVGFNVYRDFWLSVGYNLDGFRDEDFDGSDYTVNGAYAKLRVKFDTDTMRGLLDSFK